MIEKEIIKDQKETIHRLQDECIEKTKIILKLHQENERLKEEIKRYGLYIKQERDNNYRYKQALEEIKEIAKENMNCEGENNPCPQSQDILDKINEVIGV